MTQTQKIRIGDKGTFYIDNELLDLTDRVADHIPVELDGGELRTIGRSTHTEVMGALRLVGGQGRMSADLGSARMRFDRLEREPGAVLVKGSARVYFENPPALINGMISAWVTTGSSGSSHSFATYDPAEGVVGLEFDPAVPVSNTLPGADPGDNIIISEPVVTTLVNDQIINSLTIGGGSRKIIDLGGNTLNILTGGLIRNGNSPGELVDITNGVLTAGGDQAGEMVLWIGRGSGQEFPSDFARISATIADNAGQPVAVTKAGTGKLILDGVNTYTGPTTLAEGHITIEAASAVPQGNDFTIHSGQLRLEYQSDVPLDLGTLRLREYGKIFSPSDGPAIDADLYLLEDGVIRADITGSGHVEKNTIGDVYLMGDNGGFTGDIDVFEGVLVAGREFTGGGSSRNALGTGVTKVHGGAMLMNHVFEGDVDGSIDLLGGDLTVGHDGRRYNGRVRVIEDSRIVMLNGFSFFSFEVPTPADIEITGSLVLADGRTLNVIGPGTLTLSGQIESGVDTHITADNEVIIMDDIQVGAGGGQLSLHGPGSFNFNNIGGAVIHGGLNLKLPQDSIAEVSRQTIVEAGGVLTVDGAWKSSLAVSIEADGLLTGAGLIGSHVDAQGVIAPGGVGQLGALSIAGNLSLAPLSTVVFDISYSDADQVIVGGQLNLLGAIQLLFEEEHLFIPGDSFELIRAASILGNPEDYNLDAQSPGDGLRWKLVYEGGGLFASVVPEPASLAFLSLSGLALLSRRTTTGCK